MTDPTVSELKPPVEVVTSADENFVKPLLSRSDIELVLQSGSLEDLLPRLRVHALDLVLSNRRVHADADHPWRSRSIARQPVSLVGKPRPKRRAAPRCLPPVSPCPPRPSRRRRCLRSPSGSSGCACSTSGESR